MNEIMVVSNNEFQPNNPASPYSMMNENLGGGAGQDDQF